MQLLVDTAYQSEHTLLVRIKKDLSRYMRLILYGENDCSIPAIAIFTPLRCIGYVGRPKITINLESVEFLRDNGYTWNQVADAIGVSRTTLWRRLREEGIELNSYTGISDDELDSILDKLQKENPNCGQQLLYGHLVDRGIRIQRHSFGRVYIEQTPYESILGGTKLLLVEVIM